MTPEIEKVLQKLDAMAVDEMQLSGEWTAETAIHRCAQYGALVEELVTLIDRTPMVIVTRDSDASNRFDVFDGDVECYDIDLGRSDLHNADEWLAWAGSHLTSADGMEAARPSAAACIRNAVFDTWHRDFEGLDVGQVIDLAKKEGLL